MKRAELQFSLDKLLACDRFVDYCPNGLQVEGRDDIARVVCGVTANLALIERSIEVGADAIVVHHGWFWKGEDSRIVGIRKRRMELLLKHDINLFAYHLPLDAHPELGNNAQLAHQFGWLFDGVCVSQPLVHLGRLPRELMAGEFVQTVAKKMDREPFFVGDEQKIIRRIGWCSGAAQGYFEHAINAGVDLFLSGEISEQTVHLARESGVSYLAAGHHATELYGVQALGRYLNTGFGLEVSFVDIGNPV